MSETFIKPANKTKKVVVGGIDKTKGQHTDNHQFV